MSHHHRRRRRPGFTLIELLVVILIILIVCVVALPPALSSFNRRQVSESARLLQGALVGARDQAIHDGGPSGIRLLPDPAFPVTYINGQINPYAILAYNRVVPIGPAPEYQEGKCIAVPSAAIFSSVRPPPAYAVAPSLVFAWAAAPATPLPALYLVACPVDPNGFPNSPTSWYWNVRVGDRIQVNNAGPWYTVAGPSVVGPFAGAGNSEWFVNAGLPGQEIGLPTVNGHPVEFLMLVNGRDDNNNGWTDEGWDGVDNDGINGTDDVNEWETEAWQGVGGTPATADVGYTIRRRPFPISGAREIALPSSMVVDATTALMPVHERSRLPVNPFTGAVDILINPDGTVAYSSIYGVPSSFGLNDVFYHFWLAERSDLAAVQTVTNPDGSISPVPIESGAMLHYLPIQRPGGSSSTAYRFATLAGDYSLLTLFTRSGQILANEDPPFDDPIVAAAQGRPYNPLLPFVEAQRGIRQ